MGAPPPARLETPSAPCPQHGPPWRGTLSGAYGRMVPADAFIPEDDDAAAAAAAARSAGSERSPGLESVDWLRPPASARARASSPSSAGGSVCEVGGGGGGGV